MTILEEICARKRRDLEDVKEVRPARELYAEVEHLMDNDPHRSFADALKHSDTGIIAEFKRKSPSLGWIHEDLQPEDVVPGYVKGGATALSILTDEPYFGGNISFVERMRPQVDIPILRKDFTIDEYQIFEAKAAGADAILLIAACLKKDECHQFAATARQLNIDVLLEIHEERELDYIGPDVTVVGVNNRNLHVFKTDLQTSFLLSGKIPDEFVRISESGIKTVEDLRLLRAAGYQGFLMGERFMKNGDPAKALQDFIKALKP
jgi:indole-3-glycerol phosphate synthase